MADTLPGLGAEPDDEEAEVDDDLHGGEESEAQSGLGRGLAAIIPTLADLDAPAPPARRRRRRGGVAALLGPPTEDTSADEEDAPAAPVSPPRAFAPGTVPPADPVGAPDAAVRSVEEVRPPPAGPTKAVAAPDVPVPVVGGESGDAAPDVPVPVVGGESGDAAPDVPVPVVGGESGDAAPDTVPVPVVGGESGDAAPDTVHVPVVGGESGDAAPDTVHVPAPSAVRKLRDDLVGALLDGLANTMALDLCAYLHEGPGEEPHLFLQSPSMDTIGADRTFGLFAALHAGLRAGRSEPEFAVAGFRGVAVATLGEGSRGLWAVARAGDVTGAEREVAARFCRSFGRAVHQLDGAAASASTSARPLRVEVHRARDSVLAEVQVRLGDQIRPGHGRAATQVEAITRAVLVAAGRPVTFRYASEVAHEGEHAAVVLVEGGDHAVALGSALSPESGGVATAQAALRALDGLTA